MTEPKPYTATSDELRAIDEALTQKVVPSPETLPEYYRLIAVQCRARAEDAPAPIERRAWLELAEQYEQAAAEAAGERGLGFV